MPNPDVVSLAHGFWSADHGKDTLHRLVPWFEEAGSKVLQFNYGWVGRIGVRLLTDRFGRILAGMTWGGSTFVGYSNGNYIGHKAMMDYAAPFKRWIAIAPALDRDTVFPPQLESVLVVASPHDLPVRIARWIPFSGWGDMGRVGYKGPKDDRVTTVFTEDLLPFERKVGHGGHFDVNVLGYLAPTLLHFHKTGEVRANVSTRG